MLLNTETLLNFLRNALSPQSKRDIALKFGIKGGQPRIEMKQILKSLVAEGRVTKHSGGAYSVASGMPAATIIEITEIDIDGDVFAKPTEGTLADLSPRIEVMPDKKGHPALKIGDRALANLIKRDDGVYEATVIKRMDTEQGRVLGLVTRQGNAYILEPANKKIRDTFDIPARDLGDAKDGDMVVGEIQPVQNLRRKQVRITEIIGAAHDRRAISLLSLHEVGLRTVFPEEVLKSTEKMIVPPLKGRDDLRKIPLITIDGADARDFDDAVFAERDTDGGFHLIVAIADVSHYVHPGSALDKEAYARGNSTYFPDRVLPMLPEALSNDLCSLRPDEDRACIAAHLYINKHGQLQKHKFIRGLMRSHARCTYEQVQKIHDDGVNDPLLTPLITELYAAFKVLDAARQKRGALDLDLPERQILIDDDGNMTGVRPRTRLDAHKLIEEFMILANVAAAEALEKKAAPCVYRVHEPPKADRLQSASEFIEGFGMSLPKAQSVSPLQLNRLLHQATDLPYGHLIHQVILRTQSQARYASENAGHYGLALAKYAHFTSPIRRYADLLVHRSLVEAYGLGDGGLSDTERVRMEEMCVQISACERLSIEAERNSVDRFTAAYLSDQIGATFMGRISGVTRFGLFIALNDTGADGLVPIRALGDDYYIHDEQRHALIGRRKRTIFRLGAEVQVRIKEADGLTGSSIFEMVNAEKGANIPGFTEPKRLRHFDKKKPRGGKGGDAPKPSKPPRKPKAKKTTPKHIAKKKAREK